ncbi:hypothetical protein ACQ4PT_047305 [Festuca glaucescens]
MADEYNSEGPNCRYAWLTDCRKPLKSSTNSPAKIRSLHFANKVSKSDAFSPAKHVRVLDFRTDCRHDLMVSIGELKQLRYLSISCGQFPNNPRVIGDTSSNIHMLEHASGAELKVWRLENVKSPGEARSINLSEKQAILELRLWWTSGANRSVDDMELLTELVPPTTLKTFDIGGYCSVGFPDWLMSISNHLPNLVKMVMQHLPNCKSLPPLGQLPNLREISLVSMESLEEWDTSYLSGEDSVNALEKLYIDDCPKLRIRPHFPRAASWSINKSDNVLLPQRESMPHIDCLTAGDSDMPLHQWGFLHHLLSLRKLRIDGCTDLTFSPEICGALHSLKSLGLERCSHAKLEELLGELTSLQELTIWDRKRQLEELPNKMRHLTKLQSLTLWSCPSLRQLPQWLGELGSLKKIEIGSCRAIMTLPESIQELTNLQELKICATLS